MGLIERFATASVAPQSRLDFWNRIASETFEGMLVDSESERFEAELWRWSLGDLMLVRPRAQVSTVRRWPDAQPAAADKIMLHLQHRGSSRQVQEGAAIELEPGDFSLCRAHSPYILDVSTGNDMLVLEMPREQLIDRIPALNNLINVAFSGRNTSARLLHDFMLSLWRQGDQSHADPLWQQNVADILLDLLALAVQGQQAQQPAQYDTPLGARVIAFIRHQLTDPALRTSTIADALGVTPRTIQNVFASMTTTPTAYILERRLERASELLAAPGRMRSITEIAFECGFNDSAYFARCFRQRFGVTPSEFREGKTPQKEAITV